MVTGTRQAGESTMLKKGSRCGKRNQAYHRRRRRTLPHSDQKKRQFHEDDGLAFEALGSDIDKKCVMGRLSDCTTTNFSLTMILSCYQSNV